MLQGYKVDSVESHDLVFHGKSMQMVAELLQLTFHFIARFLSKNITSLPQRTLGTQEEVILI